VALFEECSAGGADAETCASKARTAVALCLESECTAEPPTCEERCRQFAEGRLQECAAAGREEEMCAAEARAAHARCVTLHCDPLPGCEDRCAARASRAESGCLAIGGDAERCAQLAARVRERCSARFCDGPPLPEPCALRCELLAQEKLARALGAGEDEAHAGRPSRRAYARCVRRACGADDR